MAMETGWRAVQQILTEAGVTVGPGLTTVELRRAESVVGAEFPRDLRAFLSEGLPIGRGFPDWRVPDSTAIRDQLEWPFEGIAFDIKNNVFWWDAWGARPQDLDEAVSIARTYIAAAPRLIPVAGHRYIPAEPTHEGNPVFSVYQTDIIYYGTDLATYLRCEFHRLSYADAIHQEPRSIRFWSELVIANN